MDDGSEFVLDRCEGEVVLLGELVDVAPFGFGGDGFAVKVTDFCGEGSEGRVELGKGSFQGGAVPGAVSEAEGTRFAENGFGELILIFGGGEYAEHDSRAAGFHVDGSGPDVECALCHEFVLKGSEQFGGGVVDIDDEFDHVAGGVVDVVMRVVFRHKVAPGTYTCDVRPAEMNGTCAQFNQSLSACDHEFRQSTK